MYLELAKAFLTDPLTAAVSVTILICTLYYRRSEARSMRLERHTLKCDDRLARALHMLVKVVAVELPDSGGRRSKTRRTADEMRDGVYKEVRTGANALISEIESDRRDELARLRK